MKLENENLQAVIETIRNDAVVQAEQRSQEILSAAEKKATEIIEEAKRAAANIRQDGEADVRKMEQASRDAIVQAGRDVVLSAKDQLITLLNACFRRKVADCLHGRELADLIRDVIQKWNFEGKDEQIEIILSPEDHRLIERVALAELRSQLKIDLFFRPTATIEAGIEIGEKDGNMVCNLTDEGITEILCSFLNPRIAKMLQESLCEKGD